MKELLLTASDETLYTVLDAIKEELDKNGCPEDVRTQILISAEEIFVNIAHYAYGGEAGEAVVTIEISSQPKVCTVVFKDKGTPYNPLEKEDPDTTLSADERQIGGLGVFMVKTMMDSVNYRYEDGANVFSMSKAI
jgi:anti-sigma regulatory factor (Ser/Thr protein kinase)